jgi:hypothetical protein
MNQLDLAVVAHSIRGLSSEYETKIINLTRDVINDIFKRELKEINKEDVIEIPNNLNLIFDYLEQDKDTEKLIYTENGNKFIVSRIMTPRFDIDEAELVGKDSSYFMEAVSSCITDYVSGLPTNITHASVPQLFIKKEGFLLSWFIYGYYCVPCNGIIQTKGRHDSYIRL